MRHDEREDGWRSAAITLITMVRTFTLQRQEGFSFTVVKHLEYTLFVSVLEESIALSVWYVDYGLIMLSSAVSQKCTSVHFDDRR
jgi:hypothetical protein